MKTETKKPSKKKPAIRQAIKRIAPGRPGGAALLKVANAVGLKLMAAEGLSWEGWRLRALASIERIHEGGMTYDKFRDEDWILMLQYFRDRGKDDPDAEAIVKAGGFEPDGIFALIDSSVDNIAWEDQELNRLSAAIDAKYKEYGAKDDEYWPDGEAPEDMEVLRTAFDDRFRQLKIAILRHHQEYEMADLLGNDPDAYAARIKSGQAKLDEYQKKKGSAGIPGPVK